MTIFEAYNSTKQKLKSAGIEDYVFEAKEIIKHITGLSANDILAKYSTPLTDFQQNNLVALLHQREVRYPLQYIFGKWDFYGRTFFVGPGVLIPRQDTETVIDVALDYLKDTEAPEILDLCAGSGCIGITLTLEKYKGRVDLLEKYDEAIAYAEKNIRLNEAINTTLYKGDIFLGDLSDNKYDLIVSNPPYIPENEMKDTSPEVAFEPETALIADDNGLQFYKAIINNYKNALKQNGMLLFEVGMGEANAVADLLKEAGLKDIKIKKDLGGIDRAVSAIKE